MSGYRNRPEAKGYLKVLEVLREWDPIGVISEANQDEYDSYAAPIVRMLDDGATVEELGKYMSSIVIEGMGIGLNQDKTSACAEQLVRFWKEWKRA